MIVLLDKYLRSVWFLGTTEVYFLQEQKKRAPSGDTPCIKYLRLLAHNFFGIRKREIQNAALYPHYQSDSVVCHVQHTTSRLKMQDAPRKKFVE